MLTPEYDFDTIVDRRNTNCGRWDTMDKKYGTSQLIHLGVADMDVRVPEPIIDVSFPGCRENMMLRYKKKKSCSVQESISPPACVWILLQRKGTPS